MRKRILGVFAAVILSSATAMAADPAAKCEAGKLKLSGAYAACRLKADAVAISKGVAADYTKCEQKLSEKWSTSEEKAAGQCPATGDQAAIQSFIESCDSSVADALAGGSLPLDPAVCDAALDACETDSATCASDLSTCNADLSAADLNLSNCNADLGTCDADLTNCGTSLNATNADLATRTSQLATCSNSLSTANADLVTRTNQLATCNNNYAALAALPHWTCPLAAYDDDDDECDCGCGVVDPDCAGPTSASCEFCSEDGSCNSDPCPGSIDSENNSKCATAPPQWTCDSDFYGSSDGCDCGCGAHDPDCPDATSTSCNYCSEPGSCSTADCPGTIDPDDNSQCITSPGDWTCDPDFYDNDDGCDCGCGTIDPDCPDATSASCQFCDESGSCSTAACPGTIDPDDNWKCN